MTTQHDSQADFDRVMREWFASDARGREPEHLLGSVLQRASRTRRLPGWLLPERWLPMQLTMRVPAVPRPSPLLLVLAALILAALLAAVLVGAPRRLPAPFGPAANGLLAYDTNSQIFVANADGTGKRALVRTVPHAAAPTFSPDGTQIAFWGDGSPDSLFVVGADGADLRKISGDLWIATDKAPVWSPDGRTLAFTTESGPDRHDQRIYVVDVTPGAVPRLVAGGGADDVQAYFPSWSPDSAWIAYIGVEPSGSSSLWLVHPSGTDAHALSTAARVAIALPQWAPSTDQPRLAYAAAPTLDGQQDVFVYDMASGVERAVTADPADERFPAWSPDGRRLAWLAGRDADLRILTDGTTMDRPLPVGAIGGPPSWSPDGTLIFGSNGADTAITVVPVDGTAPIVSIPHTVSQGQPSQQRLAP